MRFSRYLALSLFSLALAATVQAETRVTYKSAKSTSSYYQMGVQLATAMKAGTDGDIIDVTVSYPLDLETQMLEWSGRK